MLQKWNEKIDRFCAKHPRFGIPGLMKYIVIGNVLIYLLAMFSSASALSFLYLDVEKVLHGELWRILTFIFVPSYERPLMMAIALYFYYSLGTVLENQWGSGRFTIYYLGGVLLTVTATFIGYFFMHSISPIAGVDYVHLSIFLAFAMLYPDMQVLIFFIIPVKIKWIAYLDAAGFAFAIILSLVSGNLLGAMLPVFALLNFFVFFSPYFARFKARQEYRNSPQAQQYRAHVRQEEQRQKQEAQRGWHHKCSVCGKTDEEYPDLQFRYCSRCAGYHCYCSEHIFNHVHFTEENG